MTETEDRNKNQIIRIDARNCFVESLNDSFEIGKAHMVFASYDLKKPSGQRQTNNINIYIDVPELLELCRKLASGEMRWIIQNKKKNGDNSPIYQCLGGTSAEKLMRFGKPRADGKSLSRTAQLICGNKTDFLFIADSGAGEVNEKGLIVPRFGKNPENHVSVSMSFDLLSELLLMTKAHYQAWLTAWYAEKLVKRGGPPPRQGTPVEQDTSDIRPDTMKMF